MTTTLKSLVRGLLQDVRVNIPPVPVKKIAERKGVRVEYVPLKGGVSGVLYNKEGNAVIGVNVAHPKTRQRFTIAHELGHHLLNHEGQLFIDKGYALFRSLDSKKRFDPREQKANEFAAELLMPKEFLVEAITKKHLDFEDQEAIDELARLFGVSTQALNYRLINLRLVRMF